MLNLKVAIESPFEPTSTEKSLCAPRVRKRKVVGLAGGAMSPQKLVDSSTAALIASSKLKVGDSVKLKPKDLSKSLGIKHTVQGGEAAIIEISIDSKGLVYTVCLRRNTRNRSARREDLIVHYKPKKNRRENRG